MKNKTIGLVLHLSSREHEGRRVVDDVRKAMVRFVCKTDSEDGFYLYHPQILEAAYSQGEKTAALGNFETDGFKFDLGFAMKQTLYVTARGDEEKVLLLVTDSFLAADLTSVKKVLLLNRKEDLGCKILVIGLGQRYDESALTDYASKTPEMAYLHSDPNQVDVTLENWFNLLTEEA